MIYVRVELWPGGDKHRASVLAEARIANVTGPADIASYKYTLMGKKQSPMGEGIVHDFPRKRLMAWDLIYRALRDARGLRNKLGEPT